MIARLMALVEERVAARRRGIVAAMVGAGIESAVESDGVRLWGPGLMRRWMGDLALRQAGRNAERERR